MSPNWNKSGTMSHACSACRLSPVFVYVRPLPLSGHLAHYWTFETYNIMLQSLNNTHLSFTGRNNTSSGTLCFLTGRICQNKRGTSNDSYTASFA